MELLDKLMNLLEDDISLPVIFIVLAGGEIIKRILRGGSTFWKVLIFVTPLTVIYAFLKKMPYDVFFFSYVLAFWLYPLILKPIMKILGIYAGKQDFVGGRPKDR